MSRAMKQKYDQFIEGINQMAAETGDLHALQEIRAAIEELEKE